MVKDYNIIRSIARKRERKNLKRKRLKIVRHKGYLKHFFNILKQAAFTGNEISTPPNYLEQQRITFRSTKPGFSETIKYLATQQKAFSKKAVEVPIDGVFVVPRHFSLTIADDESFLFLKQLFYALYHDKCAYMIIDYENCEMVDLDASVCMDIMLKEFSQHIAKCRVKHFPLTLRSLKIRNVKEPKVAKLLLSLGAYQTLKGLNFEFEDIIKYPLCIGSKKRRNAGAKREVDITNLVDYVLNSLAALKKELTADAEDNLYKVIGEILINAEEHSDMDKRYSIGYFQKTNDSDNDCYKGVINLVIFNFGKTIYEKFKDGSCPNQDVVKQMTQLSESYTHKSFFSPAQFEEETLWTLYALQEGVTSHKDWKRGNGSIRFIDSFFKLKGDDEFDNISTMTIVSGNARIVFDGSHKIIEREKQGQRKPLKLMTFNKSGTFDEQPDKKFVNFANNYFPGTMIVAKIGIKQSILDNIGG